ncbi:hypothetical protein GCM10023340_31470 [Nocardioides marinquilinus]|uniref:DUF4440 domain-containing protein n=1 Tax=Nocardioides marinquilinus TaxID=1210400 RepID=A0ABP9Q057_9ACTN
MSDEDEVVAAADERAAALGDGDAEALTALLHAGFRWLSHRGEALDRDEYVRRNTGGATAWVSQRLDGARVTVVGDTAVLHAEAVDVVRVDGTPTTFRMPVTQVWVRDAGLDAGWRCLAGHAGPRLD